MDIERVATSFLSLSISKTKYLSPFINDGDKEPSWDGHIYVYCNKDKKKEHLQGRVPVQIKGKIENNLSQEKITYSVNVSDLNNYLVEGGTVYFVVYIDEDMNSSKIYYSCLLPFNINLILKKAGKQKSFSIELKSFPDDNTEKANLFFNFIYDKTKQASSLDKNILSLSDLNKLGEIESFSFGFRTFDDKKTDPYEYLFNNGVYVYAEPKGFNVKIPVEYIPNMEEAILTFDRTVCVSDIKFYDHYEVVRKIDINELHIGKSFIFTISKNTIKFNYKLSGNLQERIKDLDFLLEFLKEYSLTISDKTITLAPDELNIFDKEQISSQLKNLKAIQHLLDLLKVNTHFDYEKISENDAKKIYTLILSLLHNKPVLLDNSEVPPIAILHISNLRLALVFNKLNDNTFVIKNFFNTYIYFFTIDEDGNKYEVSQYFILKKIDFLILSNIDYTAIKESIISIPDNEYYFNHVNLFLLEMLLAFDAGAPNCKELIDTTTYIAEWLLNKTESISKSIQTLNYLQCVLRERGLNEKEIDDLCMLIEQEGQEAEVLIGANLLLDNQVIAKRYFSKLSEERKEIFKQYPIYKFWIE